MRITPISTPAFLSLLSFALMACSAAPSTDAQSSNELTGDPSAAQAPPLVAEHLVSGPSHTCATTREGLVRCWGSGGVPQGLALRATRGPVGIAKFPAPALRVVTGTASTCAFLARGGDVTLGLPDDGTLGRAPSTARPELYCWGESNVRTCDESGGNDTVNAPRRICAFDDLSYSWDDGAGVTQKPSVVAMAMNPLEQLCYATQYPRETVDSAQAVDATAGVTCNDDSMHTARVPELDGQNVTMLAMSATHRCAASASAMWCWGQNENGQLGDGTTDDAAAPVAVQGLAGGIVDIAAGTRFTCAATTAGVQCFGNNVFGSLGDGTEAPEQHAPTLVKGLPANVSRVVAGEGFACALASGDVYCWGYDDEGVTGNETGSVRYQRTAVKIQGLAGKASDLSAGVGFACAATTAGVMCWGRGMDGELGRAGVKRSAKPVFVPSTNAFDAPQMP